MTKLVADTVIDAALSYIKTNATTLHVCSGDPADRAAAITNSLADLAITSTDWTGPADGDVSGRKLTKDQETGITIDTSGTAAHICIIDGSILLQKTSVTSQALTAGGTVTVNAYDHEIADAT